VPPWFSALQVLVQVTVQVAPAEHVKLDPAPTVAVQSLEVSHRTLAEAPAFRSQVEWSRHSRLALSAAPTSHRLPLAHWVVHDAPQAPVHETPPPHENMQPAVRTVQAPVPLRSHAPPPEHVQRVPMQVAGAPEPVEEPEEPQAAAKARSKAAAARRVVVMKRVLPELPFCSDAGPARSP
jgi:hypothetical protein